jgi:hypothetical protein
VWVAWPRDHEVRITNTCINASIIYEDNSSSKIKALLIDIVSHSESWVMRTVAKLNGIREPNFKWMFLSRIKKLEGVPYIVGKV